MKKEKKDAAKAENTQLKAEIKSLREQLLSQQ